MGLPPVKTLVIGHRDLDGASGVILLKRELEPDTEIEYVLCDYNDVDDVIKEKLPSINAKYRYDKTYIVDICPTEETCEHLHTLFMDGTKISLLDHHVTRAWVDKYIWATYDKDRCGTEMTNKYLIENVKDGDTWDENEFAAAVGAWDLWRVTSDHRKRGENLNSILKFVGFDDFISIFSAQLDADFKKFGELIQWLDAQKKQYVTSVLKSQLHKSYVHSDGGGNQFKILFVTDYVSDVGYAVLKHKDFEDLDYVVLVNPCVNTVSLRSRNDGVDVSKIAKRFGGGGHKTAAGFAKNFTGGMENKLSSILNRTEY